MRRHSCQNLKKQIDFGAEVSPFQDHSRIVEHLLQPLAHGGGWAMRLTR